MNQKIFIYSQKHKKIIKNISKIKIQIRYAACKKLIKKEGTIYIAQVAINQEATLILRTNKKSKRMLIKELKKIQKEHDKKIEILLKHIFLKNAEQNKNFNILSQKNIGISFSFDKKEIYKTITIMENNKGGKEGFYIKKGSEDFEILEKIFLMSNFIDTIYYYKDVSKHKHMIYEEESSLKIFENPFSNYHDLINFKSQKNNIKEILASIPEQSFEKGEGSFALNVAKKLKIPRKIEKSIIYNNARSFNREIREEKKWQKQIK